MSKSPLEILQQLLDQTQSLQMATLNAQGGPAISYAPFIRDEQGCFYVFISQLASHTRDLLQHPQVAIMVIADEHETRQIFARTRATYQCQVEVIGRDEALYNPLLDRMQARFGEVMGVLRGLGDFVLFRLKPQTGRFVMGFGQAFVLAGQCLQELQPIGPGQA